MVLKYFYVSFINAINSIIIYYWKIKEILSSIAKRNQGVQYMSMSIIHVFFQKLNYENSFDR